MEVENYFGSEYRRLQEFCKLRILKITLSDYKPQGQECQICFLSLKEALLEDYSLFFHGGSLTVHDLMLQGFARIISSEYCSLEGRFDQDCLQLM